MLKSEGVITGRLFELTGWRRDGLMARLRAQGFVVRTLADRVEALPAPPPPPPIGTAGWRALTHSLEQIFHFDLRNLRWHHLDEQEREGQRGVVIYSGWVLRRRKGRGTASFYLAVAERHGGIGLSPLDETQALLAGYAQAVAFDPRALLAERYAPSGATEGRELIALPDVDLPSAYRNLLDQISERSPQGRLVDKHGWALAGEMFARLGIRLLLDDPR